MAAAAPAGKILVLFHRGHEHSGRWEDVVDALAPEGFTVFAWDARGNGRSEGPRDDAENFGCYARDAELFVRHLSETEGVPIEQIAVVGHSVGAAIVAAWIHDYAPRAARGGAGDAGLSHPSLSAARDPVASAGAEAAAS